jgi:hypothetical protein
VGKRAPEPAISRIKDLIPISKSGMKKSSYFRVSKRQQDRIGTKCRGANVFGAVSGSVACWQKNWAALSGFSAQNLPFDKFLTKR